VGVELEDVQQVMIGIASIIGAPAVASVGGKILCGVGPAVAIADSEVEDEEGVS
jgi:thiamine biosynthesis protein ThiC